MPDPARTVVRNRGIPGEEQYRNALIAGLARVCAVQGRGAVADLSGRSTRALDKLFAGDSGDTSGKGLLDFLIADPTALDEVLAIYGYRLQADGRETANDLATIADLSNLAGQFADALADGHRDHRETLALSAAIRPLMNALSAICAEADAIKIS